MSLDVAHLDHSRAAGGAELALRRMVLADPTWVPRVFLPGRPQEETDDGPFAGLGDDGMTVAAVGPPQEAGLGEGAGAARVLRGLGTIARMAHELRADAGFRKARVVHTNTSRAALYGALATRCRSQALVVHLRDFVTPGGVGRFGSLALRRIVLPRADGVVANSKATLETAAGHLRPGTPTLVLQSPLGLHGSTPPRATSGDVRTVGMVARLAPWKGQALLVEAFAEAFAGSGVRLRLVGAAQFGEQDYVDEVQALARRLGVADRVDLVGHVDDVASEIAALDICVQASLRPEPLGQNVLQYLALGRPTIVAGAGGPVEWVTHQENGLVFRPGDAGSLAAELARLGTDAELRGRLARAAGTTPGIATDGEVTAMLGDFFRTVVAAGR